MYIYIYIYVHIKANKYSWRPPSASLRRVYETPVRKNGSRLSGSEPSEGISGSREASHASGTRDSAPNFGRVRTDRRDALGPSLARGPWVLLYYTILYYTILYYTILHYTILHYTMLYSILY